MYINCLSNKMYNAIALTLKYNVHQYIVADYATIDLHFAGLIQYNVQTCEIGRMTHNKFVFFLNCTHFISIRAQPIYYIPIRDYTLKPIHYMA